MALRRVKRVTLALFLPLVLSACESTGQSSGLGDTAAPRPASDAGMSAAGTSGLDDMPKPGTAAYSCGDGARVTIQNLGTSVRVMGPDGSVTEDLPASPPNQTSRFGANHDAIVLDGNDALIMKAGARPISCTR